MERRCGFCFHPLDAATAACRVCDKAPTARSPFGSSSAKPADPVRPVRLDFRIAPTRSSEPARSTASVFGQARRSASLGFSTTPLEPAPSTASFGHTKQPASLGFSHTPPEPARSTCSFGQRRQPAFSFSTTPQAPAPATASFSAFGFSTPEPSSGKTPPPATPSPFGSTKPAALFSFGLAPTQSSEPAALSTGSFGQAGSLISFSPPTTPEPASARQAPPPAAASFSAFGFSNPDHWFTQPPPPSPPPPPPPPPPPATPPSVLSFLRTPPEPANTNTNTSVFGQTAPPPTASFPAFGFSTPKPAFGQTLPPANPFLRSMPPLNGSATQRCVFDDDEPVDNPLAAATLYGVQEASTGNGPLVLKTHCELPAVARGCARDSFAVLVHAKAPGAADRTASIDLVTVLDVSGSMGSERKLELLKEAMGFVIDKLGPADRLSVVSFSHQAHQITPLTRMSDAGKASAKRAVGSLVADGQTDILKGLDTAAKVLDGRRYMNAVASVILLSDGHDNCNRYQQGANGSYDYLVPRSLAGSNDGNRSTPVHTFGFGTYHDAKAMDAVADATGGTYSFIENQAVVQDAFAQCIGGLLSVAVQEAWITVACPHPDVRVRFVNSGRYENRVMAYGRAASVDVGELYADEERHFLLFVDVPRVADDEDVTHLIRVSCPYKDTATGKSTEVVGEDAVVRRPAEVTSQEDQKPSLEVRAERFRVEATEDIAAARAAAERGDHAEAARILDRRREAAGTGDLANDARCAALVYELAELSARVWTRREYEQTGRSSILVGMSSHAQQRASSANFFGCMASPPLFGSAPSPFGASSSPAFGASSSPAFGAAFATPAMKDMVDSSRKIREEREQQQQYSSATTIMPNIFARNN
ncbi:unnamed protein product [Alopecurus aequalis]